MNAIKRIGFYSFLYVALSIAVSAQPIIPDTGPFEPTWESLSKQYDCPDWFRDAKFGIWAHWGPNSVAEYGDWFPRRLYIQGNNWAFPDLEPAYTYHLNKYGHPSEFGFKDLIPLFKAEKWDPEALMKLYHKAGARYFVSMAMHHDNFDMWNSKYQPWNSVNMGPKRDIIKEWQQAAKHNNMKFGVSNHGEGTWRYWEITRMADTTGSKKGVPYDGWLTKADGKGKWWEGYDPHDLYGQPHKGATQGAYGGPFPGRDGDQPDSLFKQSLINRTVDLIDNYHPDLIYFDGGIPFRSLDIASYFYNQNQKWNNGKNEAVIAVKGVRSEEQQRAVVLDIENGQSDILRKNPWQTDTALDGWFYTNPKYLITPGRGPVPTKDIVLQLADIVSKNGNLCLNINLLADGSIVDPYYKFLNEMAQWMELNGEAIHGTRPWEIFGEGPTKLLTGRGNQSNRPKEYTGEDIRLPPRAIACLPFSWPGQAKRSP
jgi:alpha-L-fucosidase